MSRGPTQAVGEKQGQDYSQAFSTANRLVDQGRSWSGNERNCCFLNTGKSRFADVSASTGLDFLDDARAVASVDWDGDGDLDLFQVNRTAPQVRFLRNDWDNGNRWLALRLVGTACNRDAIGARVELVRNGAPGKDVRGVYAGSSFLSQSSKWVHFGLGHSTEIKRVSVRWPGGETESFTGLAAGNRYRLIQGAGRAELVSRRRETLPLVPSVPVVPSESERARVVLSAPAALPLLKYDDFAGNVVPLAPVQTTLLQLWASWCPMCQAELTEFTDRADEVSAADVRVIALSVDGLGEDLSSPEKAQEFVRRLNYPFVSGRATEQMLEKLELLRAELFSNSLPFPIPTSFLIDAEGQLVSLYLGPLEVDRLLADVELVQVSGEQLRVLGSPLKGRWSTAPRPISLAGLAQGFRDAGYDEDGAAYERKAAPQLALGHCSIALDAERGGDMRTALAHYHKALVLDPQSGRAHNYYGEFLMRQNRVTDAFRSFRNATQLEPELADAHYNLATVYVLKRQLRDAVAGYRRAVQKDPQLAKAHAALGRLLQQEGDHGQAAVHFQAALATDPYLAPAHVYLGALHLKENRFSEAADRFSDAVRISPELPDAHEGLAQALAAQGQIATAIPHYREALRLNPTSLGAAMNLAWHLSTFSDEPDRVAEEAIKLADRVVRRTRRKSFQALDVLATAYASAGRYPEAVAAAEEAAKLAAASPNKELAREIHQRLSLFRQNRPYRRLPGAE